MPSTEYELSKIKPSNLSCFQTVFEARFAYTISGIDFQEIKALPAKILSLPLPFSARSLPVDVKGEFVLLGENSACIRPYEVYRKEYVSGKKLKAVNNLTAHHRDCLLEEL